jgi:hypothetical protein
MLPLDYILAAALLSAPADAGEPEGATATYASLAPVVQQVALRWEVLDPREARYVLTRQEDYKSDMALLRRRCYDLLDAPPLADCVRFPPRSEVTQMLSFNRSYREHLEKCKGVDRHLAWEYEEALREADRLYQIWDAIRDTRCEYYYITVRRQALKRVRDTIGPEAYYNGDYPPHVPIWRFRQID